MTTQPSTPPMQISSYDDALAWFQYCSVEHVKTGGRGQFNHVQLREGIVLVWGAYPDIHTGHVLGQWSIINDKREQIARGSDWFASMLKAPERDPQADRESAMELWRACAAWGPARSPAAVKYVYCTTSIDDSIGWREKGIVTSLGVTKKPPGDDSWELVSTDVERTTHGHNRVYYHWRRPARDYDRDPVGSVDSYNEGM